MIYFLWNVLLAIFWAAMLGQFNLRTIFFGFLVGNLILWFASRAINVDKYFSKTQRLFSFISLMIKELIKSSIKIAFDIVTPENHMRPGIIKIPLDAKTSREITLFSNLLSLTPGTLSMDVSDDRKVLYVHVMYIHGSDLEKVKSLLKEKYEYQVLELLR